MRSWTGFMKFNKKYLILILAFSIFINAKALGKTAPVPIRLAMDTNTQNAITTDRDKTEPNRLIMPINTPNTTTTNIEQIKEFSKDIKSIIEEKNKQPENITPAVDDSQNKSAIKEIPTIFIKEVTFGKSNIFSEKDLNEFSESLVNKKISADEINNLINTINVSYRKKGYITAKAVLPPQQLEGGALKIEFIEGKIGEIIVQNNKHTKTPYIIDKFKEKSGDLFELKVLQNDVNNFNSTNDNIKISPKLKPGKEPGTTDIYIDTKEEFPFHITPSFDNFGRETVGLLRGGIVASHDSVFGYQDKLSSGTYLGRSSVSNFEDYNFPIFNKGTRVGGTFSYSNISVTAGSYKNMDIKGNTFLYSAYVQQPLIRKDRFTLSTSLSTNFKRSTTDIVGIPFTKLDDKSLAANLFAKYTYKKGMIYSSHTFTNGIMEKEMVKNSNWYTKYEGNITNIHNFKHGITNIFKATVQLTPHQLESLEQFQLGGMGTIRGFSEGLLLGNSGYIFSEELLFPLPVIPKKVFKYKLRDNVKFAVFADHGATFPYRGDGVSAKSNDYLTSVGMGLRVRLSNYITARTYWGFGFNSRKQGEPRTRFHFDLVSYPF